MHQSTRSFPDDSVNPCHTIKPNAPYISQNFQTFEGLMDDDIHDWAAQFQRFEHCEQGSLLNMALGTIKGTALKIAYDSNTKTLKELIEKLKKAFPMCADTERYVEKLLNMRFDLTIPTLNNIYEAQILARKAEITEEVAIKILWNKLPINVKSSLIMLTRGVPNNFEQLIEAELLNTQIQPPKPSQKSNQMMVNAEAFNTPTRSINPTLPPTPTSQNKCEKCSQTYIHGVTHCRYCHEHGHHKTQCPNRPSVPPRSPTPYTGNSVEILETGSPLDINTATRMPKRKAVEEFNEGPRTFDMNRELLFLKPNINLLELLKISAQARNQLRQTIEIIDQKPETVSTSSVQTQILLRDNLVCVNATMHGAKLEYIALIDTGSSISIIPLEIAKEINWNISTIPPMNIAGVTGHATTLVGALNKIPVTVAETCQTVDLLILDRPAPKTHHLILGNDWLNATQAVIDMTNKSIEFKKKNQTIIPLPTRSNTYVSAIHVLSTDTNKENEEDEIPSYEIELAKSEDMDHRIKPLIKKFSYAFSDKLNTNPKLRTHQHKIDTGNTIPSRIPPYRLAHHEEKILEQEIKKLREQKLIRESNSPWSSPPLLVTKMDGSFRLCIDYRRLNTNTVKDPYQMPRIDDIIDDIGMFHIFTTIDLKSGFWQIPMDDESISKTAFSSKFGSFEWLVMPFGLCNATATFQRTMDIILQPLLRKCVLVYVDDIIVFSKSEEEHLKHLEQTLELLNNHCLTINAKKCRFFQTSTSFLGYTISSKGIQTDSDKVDAIINFPKPTNITKIRQFLGLVNYYRNFIPNMAEITAPFTQLLNPHMKFNWNEEAEKTFNTIKSILTTAPILITPDWSKPSTLTTDASNVGLGAILSQRQEGIEKPIRHISRTLKGPELNYSATEKEALAIVWGVTSLRYYLYQHPFEIITDHNALVWLMTNKDLSSKLMRWSLKLAPYQFTITYKKGVDNVAADALSRNPIFIYETILNNLSAPITDITEDPEFISFLQTGKPNIPRYQNLKNMYYMKENQLYKRDTDIDKKVPSTKERLKLIMDCHLLLVHAGWRAVDILLSSSYHWPNMSGQIKATIRACATCQANNPKSIDKMIIQQNSEFIQTKISVDLIGPLPESKTGKRYILTIIDTKSRFASSFSLKNKSAMETAEALKLFILQFGLPQEIQSDNGTEFINSTIDQLLHTLDISRALSSPYSPRTNGKIERLNGTLIGKIRKYLVDNQNTDWESALPFVTFAYNVSPHTSLNGYSPFEVFFARQPKLPLSIFKPNENYYEKLEKLRILTKTEENEITTMMKLGDKVLVRDHTAEKLQPRWLGPRIIVDLKGGGAVVTTNLKGLETKVHHRNDVKPS